MQALTRIIRMLSRRSERDHCSPKVQMVRLELIMLSHACYKRASLKADDFCRIAGIGRSTLNYCLQKMYRMNFCSWVNTFRIEEAKELLKTTTKFPLNCDEVARRCGFGSIRSLSRVFCQLVGCTPRQYFMRKNHRINQNGCYLCGLINHKYEHIRNKKCGQTL